MCVFICLSMTKMQQAGLPELCTKTCGDFCGKNISDYKHNLFQVKCLVNRFVWSVWDKCELLLNFVEYLLLEFSDHMC